MRLSEGTDMNVSAIEGIVENGQIRLLGGASLPEHSKVYVILTTAESAPTARILSPHLVHPEQIVDFEKQVFEVSGNAQL